MGHQHSHPHPNGLHAQRRFALVGALVANGSLLLVQLVVGFIVGSLSLLADSLHNASDVAALGIALVGQIIAARPATRRHSYGLARAEVLAALVNGTVLLASTAWVIVVAIGRLNSPNHVEAFPLAVIGVMGLVINGVSAWVVAKSAGSNVNMRAAFWHLTADALGSVGVLVAAIGIGAFGLSWADPAASILISLLVLAGIFGLLRDTITVLLETTPQGLDPVEVAGALVAVDGVDSVHHVHIWAIDSERTALTAHLSMGEDVDLHRAQEAANECRAILSERFQIDHATLEAECHECVSPIHSGHR